MYLPKLVMLHRKSVHNVALNLLNVQILVSKGPLSRTSSKFIVMLFHYVYKQKPKF
jgi:hypothetical protein